MPYSDLCWIQQFEAGDGVTACSFEYMAAKNSTARRFKSLFTQPHNKKFNSNTV